MREIAVDAGKPDGWHRFDRPRDLRGRQRQQRSARSGACDGIARRDALALGAAAYGDGAQDAVPVASTPAAFAAALTLSMS